MRVRLMSCRLSSLAHYSFKENIICLGKQVFSKKKECILTLG